MPSKNWIIQEVSTGDVIEMVDRPEMQWEDVVTELQAIGHNYNAAELSNPDWCIKELGRLGYSLSITFTPLNIYLEEVKEIGEMNENHPTVKETLEKYSDTGGFYIYQLKGNEYVKRGSHTCPIMWRLDQTAAVALYNVLAAKTNKTVK